MNDDVARLSVEPGKRAKPYAAPLWGFYEPSIGERGWEAWFDPCNVYVIASGREERPVKIGVASNVEKRIHSLEAGNPHGLRAMFVRPVGRGLALQVERRLHRYFEPRAMGREWFDVHADEAAAAIPDLCDKADEALAAFKAEMLADREKRVAADEVASTRRDARAALDRAILRQQYERRARRVRALP